MKFSEIFNVFSRRHKNVAKPSTPLTRQFKNRLMILCRDTFTPQFGQAPHGDVWLEIHKLMQLNIGQPRLAEKINAATPHEDIAHFLFQCTDEQFLDFIEYIFRAESYYWFCQDENALVDQINDLFLLDDLPYAITRFVKGKGTGYVFGQLRESITTESYPTIICRDDQVTYKWAIEPALAILREKLFASANKEFLEALEDYRRGDYGDCLTKCGSAFESTMKIICDRNSWTYQQQDTAAKLLDIIIIQHSKLDTFFKDPLIITATLRNKLSKSHGSGVQNRNIPQPIAKYAINATASAILLLIEECL